MKLPRSIKPGSCLEGRDKQHEWEVGEFGMAHGLASPWWTHQGQPWERQGVRLSPSLGRSWWTQVLPLADTCHFMLGLKGHI